MKNKIIAWSLSVAVVLGFVSLSLILSGSTEVNYGIKEGKISFTESDADITDIVKNNDNYVVAENNKYEMSVDRYANITVKDKATGKFWSAVPENNGGNGKYSSSVFLRYFTDQSTEIIATSFESSVQKEQYRVFSNKNGISVEYCFGDMDKEYVYPEIISKERMEKFFKKMSDNDVAYLKRRYTLFERSGLSAEYKEYLLKEYPRLAKEDIYALTDGNIKVTGKKIHEIFQKVGYTVKDMNEDNSGTQAVVENPKVFKIKVNYELTDSGFKTYVNSDDCIFYSDYPLTDFQLLPFFDCFTKDDKGYFVLPSGSGAVMSIDNSRELDDATIKLPVYGDNLTLSSQISDSYYQATLPVFGQYKNGKGYLCIVDKAEEQATINAERSAEYFSSIHTNFALLDSQKISMTAKNMIHLFSNEVTAKSYGAEYVLISDTTAEKAYSVMANIYRQRLEKEGLLKKVSNKSVPFVAEIVNTINYNDMALGCVPVNKEFAVTTFEEVTDITSELLEYCDSNAISVILNGWNKSGLNRQKYGKINFSSDAGGLKEFKKMNSYFTNKNINLFCNLNYVSFEPFFNDKYSPSNISVRGLNNRIANLSLLEGQSYLFVDTKFQLISPDSYLDLWKEYSKEKSLGNINIGVSQLTSSLYGNYANDTLLFRKQAENEVVNTLKSIKETGKKIVGDMGCKYTLPYLSLLNNLPCNSSKNSAFEYDIPFTQMVLHGYIPYVSEEINDTYDWNLSALKMIESGSGIHAILTKNKFEDLFETDYSYLYNTNFDDCKNNIKECYLKVQEALDGLQDIMITEHIRLSDDVICVTYENGTKVYINYGESSYNVNDILVEAQDYYRIS